MYNRFSDNGNILYNIGRCILTLYTVVNVPMNHSLPVSCPVGHCNVNCLCTKIKTNQKCHLKMHLSNTSQHSHYHFKAT